MNRQKRTGLRARSALGAGFLLVAVIAVRPYAEAEPVPRGSAEQQRQQQIQEPAAPRAAQKASSGLGVFLASDAQGVERLPAFERWLGREVTVGRTYLPGENWAALTGPDFILEPWTAWRAAKPGRVLAINVPMIAPNEGKLSNEEVSVLLKAGADGAFDLIYRELANRLVAEQAGDSIIVLGWEMNGVTYSSRCAPNPEAWKAYWRRAVASMRSVRGQSFRFDFTASRGRDAIPWTRCYPGDDVVDIIGLDHYDQAPSDTFQNYVSQPYGLKHHADFAKAHGKQLSFPEWGLFRYGDRPDYIRQMIKWIDSHDVAYHSISDYCPHGVWQCAENPRSASVFRRELRRRLPNSQPVPSPSVPVIPTPGVSTPGVPTPEVPTPEVPTPEAPTPDVPTPSVPTPDIPRVSLPAIPTPSPSLTGAPGPTSTPSPSLTSVPGPTSTPSPSVGGPLWAAPAGAEPSIETSVFTWVITLWQDMLTTAVAPLPPMSRLELRLPDPGANVRAIP